MLSLQLGALGAVDGGGHLALRAPHGTNQNVHRQGQTLIENFDALRIHPCSPVDDPVTALV